MPRYEITSPEGKRFEITAPDGASQEEVLSYAQSQFPQPQQAPSALDRAGRVIGLGARTAINNIAAVPALMADAASEVVNLGAKGLGSDYRMQKPSAVLDQKLTDIGLPKPETPVERFSSNVAGGMVGVGAQLGLLRNAAGPIAAQLTQQPLKQLVAGATGPGAASATREMGGGALAQAVAGVAGGMAPFAPNLVRGERPLTATEQAVSDARDAGYRVPPTQGNTSLLNKVLEGVSGKITTAQLASSKNQGITNAGAAADLGLDPKTTITPAVLQKVRAAAGNAYGAIKDLPMKFKPDAEYAQAVQGLGADFSAAAKEFPEIASNKLIDDLQAGLSKSEISPVGAMELIKKLRFDASRNFRSDDPAKAALAVAQKQAATAVEDLIERNLAQTGKSGLVDKFRNARQLIAKSYDIEDALTGPRSNVAARQLDAGKATGNLGTAARFAESFPKAVQTPEAMGSLPGWSPLDLYAGAGLGSLGYAATGRPELAALSLLRPTVRAGILSNPYQNAFVAPTAPMARGQAATLGLLSNLQNQRR